MNEQEANLGGFPHHSKRTICRHNLQTHTRGAGTAVYSSTRVDHFPTNSFPWEKLPFKMMSLLLDWAYNVLSLVTGWRKSF